MTAASAPPTGLFARIGARSPLAVTAVFSLFYVLGLVPVFAGVAMKTKGVVALGPVLWLVGFAFAYAIVTWHRDDDTVAAGFLLGVSCTLASFVINLLVQSLVQGSLGGAALAFGFGVWSLAVSGVLAIAICIGLVWVGRLIRPGIATPVPPPRRH